MSRRVCLKLTRRCAGCHLPPRWCTCAVLRTVASPLQVDVLMHRREQWRPTSTGHLIVRQVEGARRHVWEHAQAVTADEVRMPGRELWVLDPRGEPLPADARPETVQALLIDGAWSEASILGRQVRDWGRVVSLPMTGESRYWLRAQQDGGRFSTAEALLFLLEALGLGSSATELRRQFEIHVYAGLRARGAKARAAAFAQTSAEAATLAALEADWSAKVEAQRQAG